MKKTDYYKNDDIGKIGKMKIRYKWNIKKMKVWNLDGSTEVTIFDKNGNQLSKTHTIPRRKK